MSSLLRTSEYYGAAHTICIKNSVEEISGEAMIYVPSDCFQCMKREIKKISHLNATKFTLSINEHLSNTTCAEGATRS